MAMAVLTVNCLEVANRRNAQRPLPRRYSIDHLSFAVDQSERVLILGGAGAGKDTLYAAIHSRLPGVEIADGYELLDPLADLDAAKNFTPAQLLVANGFLTRDQVADASGRLVDPLAPRHWDILRQAAEAGATFVAMAEIDKLESDKISRFSRKIVIDEGRLIADSGTECFHQDLADWIDRYARERYQCLRKDSRMLWERLQLPVRHHDWLTGRL